MTHITSISEILKLRVLSINSLDLIDLRSLRSDLACLDQISGDLVILRGEASKVERVCGYDLKLGSSTVFEKLAELTELESAVRTATRSLQAVKFSGGLVKGSCDFTKLVDLENLRSDLVTVGKLTGLQSLVTPLKAHAAPACPTLEGLRSLSEAVEAVRGGEGRDSLSEGRTGAFEGGRSRACHVCRLPPVRRHCRRLFSQ
jgi:hypothetical protein